MTGYYSIRMRASRNIPGPDDKPVPEHISGAERIIHKEEIDDVSMQLVRRARSHDKGVPDFINLKIQAVDEENIEYISSLPVFMVRAPDHSAAQEVCRALLLKAGISPQAIENACGFLENGDEQGKGLSGALVMDGAASTIENPDKKGVRATMMDYTAAAGGMIDRVLETHNLTGSRLKEALVLATKVAHAPYARAELCYSDNPDYHVGYLAIPGTGYFRIPHLKSPAARGGRVFFVHGENFSWDAYSRYLRSTPVLIDQISPFYMDLSRNEILSRCGQIFSLK